MARIGFYIRPDRPEADALAERASAWLLAAGHEAFTALAPDGTASVDGADLLVSLGGDGTLLRAVDSAMATSVPVMGVTLGHLGYLTEVEPSGLEEALQRFLDGQFEVEERMTLAVAVHGHRFHRLQPVRTRPAALTSAARHRLDPGLSPHALRSSARARPPSTGPPRGARTSPCSAGRRWHHHVHPRAWIDRRLP